jgi:hypothetical protein
MTRNGHGAVLICTPPHNSCICRAATMVTPTQPGDVLILQTEKGLKIHAIGRVNRRGQQDFHAEPPPLYVVDHAEAIAVAQSLAAPGRRFPGEAR